jgi:hypothetical protein
MARAAGFVGSKLAAARITHGTGSRFAPMILINDSPIGARDGERLIDVLSRSGVELPQVTLIGFLRNGGFNVYSGTGRVTGLEKYQ